MVPGGWGGGYYSIQSISKFKASIIFNALFIVALITHGESFFCVYCT